jgi:hypothetical protein
VGVAVCCGWICEWMWCCVRGWLVSMLLQLFDEESAWNQPHSVWLGLKVESM